MPAAGDKLHRIRQPPDAGSGFRLANTLIMPVPTRAQPGSRPGSRLRAAWAGSGRRLSLPGRERALGPASLGSSRGALTGAHAYRRRADPLLVASRLQSCSLLSVHKHVDDLCATTPSLCIGGGNAGDSAGSPEPEEVIYLGERGSCLCIQRKSVIIHMTHGKKW